MKPQEIAAIIKHARSAPLPNMDYAAAMDQLLRKLEQHFAPKPEEKPQGFLIDVPGSGNGV